MSERWFIATLSLFIIGQFADAQSLPVPPHWTTLEQVNTLLDASPSSRWQLESRTFLRADTNVLPLSLGDDEQLPPLRFEGDRAYFTAYRFKEIALTRNRWTLRYGHGKTDFYDGNSDAAQLYLDALANAVDAHRLYDVNASLHRTRVHRWTLEYAAPLRWQKRQGQVAVALHWLRLHRLQWGTLTGQMRAGQFQGDLHLLTTRGLPANETRSNGLALDIALVVPTDERWRVSVWTQNFLSRLWQRTLQDVTAQVVTNTVEPDADGFLHAVPFLQGQINRRSLRVEAKRRWTLGIAVRQGKGDGLLLLHRDFDWCFSVGYAHRIGGQQRFWFMVQGRRWEWQVGITTRRWQLQLSADHWKPSSARRATLSVGWQLPL